MFNINSTSVLAWEMMLRKSFGLEDPFLLKINDSSVDVVSSSGTPFPRNIISSNENANNNGFNILSQPIEFTEEQIRALAEEIVEEVKLRGPFLSLSEFYNRRLTEDAELPELALFGAVESALNTLSIRDSSENPFQELQNVFEDEASTTNALGEDLGLGDLPFPEAAEGNPAYGFPGWTRQADVLRSISGLLTVRDDTFTIRTYGSSTDANGNILAEAWCEAIISRTPDFVRQDEDTTKFDLPTDEEHPLGRKYEIRQFRWLNPNEV